MQETIKVHVVDYGRKSLYLRYTDPVTGKQTAKSARTSNRQAAQKEAGKWEDELRSGRYKAPSRVTWAEFVRRYDEEVLESLADATGKKAAAVFAAVEEHIGPERVASIGAEQISLLQQKLRAEKRSENTIKSHMAHLKAALRWAHRMGMIRVVPHIEMPKRTKTAKHRAITREEYERMLEAVPKVVGDARAASWRRLITGLWWSGLRIGESLNLTWDRDDLLRVDTSGRRVMLHIPAARQKSHKNEILPVAPEFAEFLLQTPEADRVGYVFDPKSRFTETPRRLTEQQVIRTICAVGLKAGVKVGTNERTGTPQYASAHDFRRAFGDRWAKRVMPAVLRQMMRHASINTTMQYYVTGDAQATADLLYAAISGNTFGNSGHSASEIELARDAETECRK